jgi:hypothetical protein
VKRREEKQSPNPIQSQAKGKSNQIKSSSPNNPSSLKTGSNSHMQETSSVITSHKLITIHLCTAHHQDHISSAVFHVIEEDRSAAPLEKQNKTHKCQKKANAKSRWSQKNEAVMKTTSQINTKEKLRVDSIWTHAGEISKAIASFCWSVAESLRREQTQVAPL